MGLEDIKKKILADAARQRDELVGRAEAERKGLFDSAALAAAGEVKAMLEQARAEGGAVKKGLVIDARIKVKNGVLAKKRELMEGVFRRAMERFMEGAGYAKWAAAGLKEAVETGREEVIVGRAERILNKAWLDGVNKKMKTRLTFSAEKGGFTGGLMVKNGGIFVNLTLDSLLDRSREGLEKLAAGILFQGK